MISSLCFIPRGAAKEIPERLNDEESLQLADQLGHAMTMEGDSSSDGSGDGNDDDDGSSDSSSADTAAATAAPSSSSLSSSSPAGAKGAVGSPSGGMAPASDDAQIIAEFGLEEYDDEDFEDSVKDSLLGGKLDDVLNNLVAEDPYLDTKEAALAMEREEEDEAADYVIRASDILFVAARNSEEDISTLEIFVYEPGESNLYVHHDVMLPALPLCTAWMDYQVPSKQAQSVERGNVIAVGSFLPGIEIYNLDVIDALEPICILGGTYEQRGEQQPLSEDAAAAEDDDSRGHRSKHTGKKDAGKKKAPKKRATGSPFVPGSHRDAVLSLSWNRQQRSLLASASADKTVKVWDMSTQSCAITMEKLHSDKVQAVAWHPQEPSVLLSAGFDKYAVVSDCRAPEKAAVRAHLRSDAEAILWNTTNASHFFASTESGSVFCFDARASQSPLFTIGAHSAACTGLSMHMGAPGMLATASVDGMVKLWNVGNSAPSMLVSRDLNVGKLFSVAQCFDDAFLVAAAGSGGRVALWNTLDSRIVAETYSRQQVPAVQLISNTDDNDDDNGEDDENDSDNVMDDVPPDSGRSTVRGGYGPGNNSRQRSEARSTSRHLSAIAESRNSKASRKRQV